jgi:RNA polymerase sigma-70 factor (ECF subfamily)
MREEAALIRRAQGGDMGAFTELVQRHDKAVLALAARYVNNAEDAKDIFQEVLIKVHRGLPAFQFRSEFATWIHRITVNTCLSHTSRSKENRHVPLNDERRDGRGHADGEDLQSDSNESPDSRAERRDMADQIRNALQGLSPQQRMVFVLRHYEGHSLSEIAHVLRCTEGTVKRYLFMATRRMRAQLKGVF